MLRLGYIDLDCVVENNETIDDVIDRLENDNDINVKLIIQEGPSGWPVIRIIGEEEEVANVVLTYWDDPDLLNQINDIKNM